MPEYAYDCWQLAESMNEAAYVVGPDDKFMAVNIRTTEMLGFTRDQLLSMGPADIDNHLGEMTIRQILDRVRGGERCVKETEHRTRDGRIIPVELSLSPAPYMGEETVLAIVRDITLRKLHHASLLQATNRNQAILHTIPDIIAEVNAERVYTWVNDAGLAFFGDDVVGRPASDYFADPQDTYEKVAPLFSGNADSRYVESWQRRKDGESRLLTWWCRALRDADGNITGALSTARDITDRRREEVARDSRLRLLELAPDLSLEEFLQAALREMEVLTSSPIGFCNFLLDDGELFAAAAGASLNDGDVCRIEHTGIRHSISEAGVWAECVRERRPLIYNDYQSIPKRKGAPRGHAKLVRMLTVPVIRGGKAVAVIGLGNKPTDYTETDVETTLGFADVIWDTAAHKQTEAALQESDRMNRRLFDSSPDAVLLSDLDGHFLDCNSTAVEMYGYSREELLGMTYKDVAASSVREQTGEHLDDILAHDGSVFEWRHQRKNGTELPVEITTVPFVAHGQQRIMATIRDLTRSKEAEEALRRSESEFRALFTAAPVGIGVTDLRGSILAFNDAALVPGGYSREDIDRMGSVTALYYDQRDRDTAMALFAERGYLSQFETRFKRKDGTPYDAMLSLTPTTFNGEPCIQAIFEDRTDKKNAERALRQSEERFKSLSAMASEGVMIHENGVILDANQAFAELVGFSDPDELIGKRSLDLLPISDSTRVRIRDYIRTRSQGSFEIELLDPEGSTRWVETGASEITYRDRPARLVLMRNITQAKLAQLERDRLQDQLRQAAKMESIGRLAGGVAHDYNNMLAVILGHVELALSQVPEAETLHEDLQEIRKAATRSASITQQLLAFARRQITTPEIVDLNSAVEGMLVMLRRLIGEQVKLRWLPGEDLGRIEIDPAQLDQVLVNLCLNARDAVARAGEVRITTSQVSLDEEACEEHEGCEPGDYLVLSIADNGTGMSQEALEHMFEPFYTTKATGEGTGLGLSTVYGIVRQNNGFIEVISTEGHGTDVRIHFPRVDVPLSEEPPGEQPGTPGGEETLLLVEDEPSVLRLATRILEGLNYRVLTAATPGEALRLVKRHKGNIALTITDVIMPEMKGWELSERLQELRPALRTLYMSGYVDETLSGDDALRQSTDFLQKPFTPQQLALAVRAALDRK